MERMTLCGARLALPLWQVAEGATGGGPAGSTAPAAEDPVLDPSRPAPVPAAPAPAADLDDEGEDEALDAAADHDPTTRVQKIANALKKSKKAKAALQTRLRDLEVKATQFDRLSKSISENPRIAAMLRGEPAPEAPPPQTPMSRLARELGIDFDTQALPFDRDENDVNRWFAKQAEVVSQALTKIADLQAKLDQLSQTQTRQQELSAERTWAAVVAQAAGQIRHEGVRTLFIDQMKSAYDHVRRQGLPYTPQQIATHYLTSLGLSPAQQQRATAAAAQAQATAEANHALPRPAALAGGGTPAPPTSKPRTLAEAAQSMRRRFGLR
jgi:hypothetical protein